MADGQREGEHLIGDEQQRCLDRQRIVRYGPLLLLEERNVGDGHLVEKAELLAIVIAELGWRSHRRKL